jgi:hypothetical protein
VEAGCQEREMQQIVYAMQFKGKATPVPGNASVINVQAVAASASITNLVNKGGIIGGFDPSAVADATFESQVTLLAGNQFEEHGNITFGDEGHSLRFTTIVQGWMGPSPNPKLQQGTVTWKLEGGEGQLNGAEGVITSNFTITQDGEVTDHHMGLIYLK